MTEYLTFLFSRKGRYPLIDLKSISYVLGVKFARHKIEPQIGCKVAKGRIFAEVVFGMYNNDSLGLRIYCDYNAAMNHCILGKWS